MRYEFLDSDLLIQKQEKRKLSEIIEQDGPEKFKEIENQANADIHVTDTVIAPGGSVIYCDEAMEHLKSIGKVIYLKLSLESLSKKTGKSERPRSSVKGRSEPEKICMRNVYLCTRNMQILPLMKRGKIWMKVFGQFWR